MMAVILPIMTYWIPGDDAYGSTIQSFISNQNSILTFQIDLIFKKMFFKGYENMYDTMYRIEHDPFILWTTMAFIISVLVPLTF